MFFGCRQDQKGTCGADIYTITPGKFEIVFFMFISNSVCKSEKLVVFFWCRQDQMGTGGANIHTITTCRKGYVGAP